MKCPNGNCMEGYVPDSTPDNEGLPLICPECQKRFCPSAVCGHRELDENNCCSECGNHFHECRGEEHDENRSCKDQKNVASDTIAFEEFKKTILRRH